MCRISLLVASVGLTIVGGHFFQANQVAYAQGRRAARWERRMAAQTYYQASPASVADRAWVSDNVNHTIDNAVDLGVNAVNENLGRAKTAYDVGQAAKEYFNSGTPGDATKAMQALAGAASVPLEAAGVGPQAAFITKFMENATNYTMGKHDEATAALKSGFAQQHLDQYKATGDPKQLEQAIKFARPEVTYRDLHEWDTRKPLTVQTHPGMPGQQPGTPVGDLAKGWKTTVEKMPFKSNAQSPLGRANDWVDWKLNQNNTVTKGTFDRTVHGSDGTTRVQTQRQQTGYGYEPGKTRIYEHTRTEFRGNRVETIGGGTQSRWNSSGSSWFRGNTQNGPSRFGGSTQSRPSFGGSSFSRPSFSSPSRSFR